MRTIGVYFAFLAMGVLTACSGDGIEQAPAEVATGSDQQELYYDAASVWSDPSISVCWTSSANATERGWVQAAVEAAIEPLSDVDFTGWGTCTGSGAEIVIDVSSDFWPSSSVGARAASTTPSMHLNHFIGSARDLGKDPANDFVGCWSNTSGSNLPSTGITGQSFPSVRQQCIEVIAVHEFAHALSIHHEQGRSDRPVSCSSEGGESGETSYGYFDWTSISNYCNPAWNNDGLLSPLDVSGLVTLYGMKTNDHVWYGIGNVRDYGSVSADTLMFDIRSQSVSGNYAPQVGDFDGNGEDDVFWYQAGSGTDPIWWGRTDRTFDTATGPTVNSTYAMATGDFDDDGKDDIFLHAPGSTADRVFWGRSDQTFDNVATAHNINGTFVPLAGDFDGDGNSDIFLYAAGSTMDVIWWGNGDRTFTSADAQDNINVSYVPVVGDFDADGRSDIFWYEPGSLGAEIIWWGRSDDTFDETTVSDISGTYVPTAGDFDGNGADDIIFSKSGDEQDPVYLFSDTTRGTYVSSKTSSVLGSNPYAGDFDGDGLDDVFWYVGN